MSITDEADPDAAAARRGMRRHSLHATFLTVMPVPYMQELFAAMREDGRVVPRVLYLESAAPDTYWGDRTLPEGERILPGRWVGIAGGRVHYNPGISAALAAEPADVYVVAGYAGLTNQLAMRWLRRNRKPWVLQAEYSGMRSRQFPMRAVRALARRPAVRWPTAIAAIGCRAAENYRRLAPPTCEVRNVPYVTDLAPFTAAARRRLPSADAVAVSATRRPPPLRLLYCGQLIERKGVDLLLTAVLRLVEEGHDIRLRMIGEGPLRSALEARIPVKCREQIEMPGFRQPEELPAEFADADAFVLPSRHDGWGVVVNQALGAGLPVIASDAVGAAIDTLADGAAGRILPAGDATALADAIREYAVDAARLSAASSAAARVAEGLSLSRGVDAWYELLRWTVERDLDRS